MNKHAMKSYIAARYGIFFIALVCTVCLYPLFTGCELKQAPTTENNATPMMLIGLDGVTFKVLYPYMKMGVTPVMHRLMVNGTASELESFKPTLSPLVWNTVLTGRTPTDHGILNFIHPLPHSEKFVPFTSGDRKVPALWNIATHYGIKGLYVNWLISWPAEKVNGTHISDRITARYRRRTWPEEAAEHLDTLIKQWRKAKQTKVSSTKNPRTNRKPNKLSRLKSAVGFVKPLPPNAHIEFLERVMLQELDREIPRIIALYVNATDPVSHLSWSAVDPALRSTSRKVKGSPPFLRLRRVYQKADALVGTLLSKMKQMPDTVILSDHGMESRAQVKPEYTIHDVNPDLLLLKCGLLEKNTNDDSINWQKSLFYTAQHDAYSDKAIFCPLVKGDNEKRQTAEKARKLLNSLVVQRGKDIPLFSHISIAQDWSIHAQFSPLDSVHYRVLNTSDNTSWQLAQVLYSRHFPPGFHHNSPPGVLILQGHHIKKGVTLIPRPSVFDILPTVFAILGLPMAQDLPGSVLQNVLQHTPPVRYCQNYTKLLNWKPPQLPEDNASPSPHAISKSEKERLKTLGYIE